jgi:hypothetical protein
MDAPSGELLGLLAHVWGEGRTMLQSVATAVATVDIEPVDLVAVQPFGARVRERRIGNGWTIMEAAYRAGIPPKNWQLIEQGAAGLPHSWAVRMAGAVHADLRTLTHG